jgi:hypothetical protein
MGLKDTTSNLGYQQITDLSSAVGLTIPAVDIAGNKVMPTRAFIVAEGNDIRWRDDGTAPTASVGMILIRNNVLSYDGDLRKIQFIQSGTGAKLNVSYYA